MTRTQTALTAATLALCAMPLAAQTDRCTLPGELMSEDATGDAVIVAAPDMVPGHDVLNTYVAELPSSDGVERIYFTLTVDRVAQAATPLSSYQVEYFTEDGVERFAFYVPYPAPAAVFEGQDLMFGYGHNQVGAGGNSEFVIDGMAEAESSASEDGTITIVLKKDVIAPDGGLLTGVAGVSQLNFGGALTSDVDRSDAGGVYEVRGACGGGKSGIFGAGSPSPVLLILLGAALLLRHRR